MPRLQRMWRLRTLSIGLRMTLAHLLGVGSLAAGRLHVKTLCRHRRERIKEYSSSSSSDDDHSFYGGKTCELKPSPTKHLLIVDGDHAVRLDDLP